MNRYHLPTSIEVGFEIACIAAYTLGVGFAVFAILFSH